jgi:transcriptional regulator with XRE-family HTH domain
MRHTLLGMSELQTTGRRREVGAELRRIRKEREWPAYKLAERLRWTASHISRSEAGKRRVTDVDVGHYLGMCGAGADVLEDLLELINEPDDFRLQRHQGRIPDQLRSLIFHESTATHIRSYQPTYIPGVFQTADYARALLEETGLVELPQIEGLVQVRLKRGAVVTGPKSPQCIYFIHENALRAPIGGPHVMYEQLLHLLFLGNRPQSAIRVVPVAAGGRGMTNGSFQIFDYKEDPPMVYLEHETTSEFLENDEEVARYRLVLKRVATVALDGQQSREFLAMMASDYERQGAQHGTEGLAQKQL